MQDGQQLGFISGGFSERAECSIQADSPLRVYLNPEEHREWMGH